MSKKEKIKNLSELKENLKDKFLTLEHQESYHEILTDFFNSDESLELKTRIYKPLILTQLQFLVDSMKCYDFSKEAGKLLENTFIKTYLKFMISFKGLSRTEFIQAFNLISEINISSENETLKDKIIKNAKKL